MVLRASLLILPVLAAAALAGIAYGNPPDRTDLEQAEAAGWNCNPTDLIFGYRHCAPRGGASIPEMATGAAAPPSVKLRVFQPDGSFAGTEQLLRSDIYNGQTCPQDGLAVWGFLNFAPPAADYYACHHFETGP